MAETADGPLAFFGDLLMRPWAANPRWVTAFDDFPLDSVVRKAELFAQAVDEDWIVVLSHEPVHPIGRLVRIAIASGSRPSSAASRSLRARAGGDAGRACTGRSAGPRGSRQDRLDLRLGAGLVERRRDDRRG